MKVNDPILAIFSVVGGTILLAVANLFGTECRMAEPGGINEGGRGFPIPYYSCGAWGESFSWAIAAVDFIILSLAVYLLLRLSMKLTQKH